VAIYITLSFFFKRDWGLNSGLHSCKAGKYATPRETLFQSILLWLFWRWGLKNYLPEAGLEPQSSQSSASQVAKIIGVSYQHLAHFIFYCSVHLPYFMGAVHWFLSIY
jgi:hypothetical protein